MFSRAFPSHRVLSLTSLAFKRNVYGSQNQWRYARWLGLEQLLRAPELLGPLANLRNILM